MDKLRRRLSLEILGFPRTPSLNLRFVGTPSWESGLGLLGNPKFELGVPKNPKFELEVPK